MHSGIPYVVSNIVLNLLWMISANLILDSRYSKRRTVFLEFLIQNIFWLSTETIFAVFSGIRFVLGLGMLIAVIQYFHTDKWAFKLMTAVMLLVATVISETLISTMLPYEMIQSGEIFLQHGTVIYSVYIFFNAAFLTILTAVFRAYKKRYHGLLVEKEWLLFSLFPISQCFAIWTWCYSYSSFNTLEHTGLIMIMLGAFIIADIALVYLIRTTSSRAELKIRNQMLEEQIRSQGNYYDQLASTYTSIRRMRHDIDNHLYTIRALLDHGKTKDAMEYADKVIEEDHINVHFSDCRNTVVASYLEKKLEDMDSHGIRLNTDIHLPALLSVSNPDLICIYGNILDNAAEACRNTEHAEIDLKTDYRSPYLTISCRNPVSDSALEKKQRIPGLERGVGHTILSHLAELYDGQFTSESENSTYTTTIILKTAAGD